MTHLFKIKFEKEAYLSGIKDSSHRASITRLRISSHNLYIERGRYETPLVPREARWCVYCYMKYGHKTVESEVHALLHCPLYDSVKNRSLLKDLKYPSDFMDLFKKNDRNPKNLMILGETVHFILDINQHYTKFYHTQDFHNNTGNCVIL